MEFFACEEHVKWMNWGFHDLSVSQDGRYGCTTCIITVFIFHHIYVFRLFSVLSLGVAERTTDYSVGKRDKENGNFFVTLKLLVLLPFGDTSSYPGCRFLRRQNGSEPEKNDVIFGSIPYRVFGRSLRNPCNILGIRRTEKMSVVLLLLLLWTRNRLAWMHKYMIMCTTFDVCSCS